MQVTSLSKMVTPCPEQKLARHRSVVRISLPAGKSLQHSHALTPISARGSWTLTVPKTNSHQETLLLQLFLQTHAASKLSHCRDLQQNTDKSRRCCVLFQIFCLTVSAGVQGGAATGKEEVGKGWPRVNGQSDPATLRESRGGRSAL